MIFADSGFSVVDMKNQPVSSDQPSRGDFSEDAVMDAAAGKKKIYTFAYDVPWEEYQYL